MFISFCVSSQNVFAEKRIETIIELLVRIGKETAAIFCVSCGSKNYNKVGSV
jgi:hypothetical protein